MGLYSTMRVHRRWLPDAPAWVDGEHMQSKSLDELSNYQIDEDGTVWVGSYSWTQDGGHAWECERQITEFSGAINVYTGSDRGPECAPEAADRGYRTRWYEVRLLVQHGKVIDVDIIENRPTGRPNTDEEQAASDRRWGRLNAAVDVVIGKGSKQ